MKIAIAQMCSGIDPLANAAFLEISVEKAAREGAAMLFTPEMSGLIDRDRQRAAGSILSEAEDQVLRRVAAAAARFGIWVHIGSLALKGREAGRNVNRGFVIDNLGAIRARYDKIHLFDVDLASGESWRESSAYSAGTKAVVVDTPVGPLGLSVCYDLRFPALYSALSDAGATLLSIPAAFTVPTGEAHWHLLLRARAIENACWVIAAAQSGVHADGRATFGHSLVIDPWGTVVLDMGDEVGLGFAEIEPALVDDVRKRIPVLQHRRPIPRPVALA